MRCCAGTYIFSVMKPIIFIGPIGAGKSTIAKMVAEELSIPSFSLDKEEHLAASVGYDIERYKRMWKENGLLDAYKYRRSFYDRLVPLFLASHKIMECWILAEVTQ